jgi:hypothetical protein
VKASLQKVEHFYQDLAASNGFGPEQIFDQYMHHFDQPTTGDEIIYFETNDSDGTSVDFRARKVLSTR